MFTLPFPLYDANASSGSDNLGDLPEWDLSDLYTSQDAPELEADLAFLEKECSAFAEDYQGKLADLNADEMLTCILRNEKISQVSGRIMSYAGLRYYQLTVDAERAQFMSNCQEKLTDFSTPLVFFTLELNRLEDDHLDALMAANSDLARYKPVLDRIRAMKPHQLSDEMETFLQTRNLSLFLRRHL